MVKINKFIQNIKTKNNDIFRLREISIKKRLNIFFMLYIIIPMVIIGTISHKLVNQSLKIQAYNSYNQLILQVIEFTDMDENRFRIKDTNSNGTVEGSVNDSYALTNYDIELFVLDKNHKIVYFPKKREYEGRTYKEKTLMDQIGVAISKAKKNKGSLKYKECMIFYNMVNEYNTLIIKVPDAIIDVPIANMDKKIELVLMVIIVFFLGVAIILNKSIVSPIEELIDTIKKTVKGNFDIRCSLTGKDEMTYLGVAFNSMMDEISKSRNELEILNRTLEKRIDERTAELIDANDELFSVNNRLREFTVEQGKQNEQLTLTLDQLKKAQTQLVNSEKMAALGGMVAGMAHEINTPLGVGVTAVTLINEKVKEMIILFENNKMKKSTLEVLLNLISESSKIAYLNVKKACDLINSFKRVSIDMSYEEKLSFNLFEMLNNTMITLTPETRGKDYKIAINCQEDLEIDSYPGVWIQIISNLIMNSIIHGFERVGKGEIEITISKSDNNLNLKYGDNGKGIPEDILGKVFEPFFTTKRYEGGTGLGLNIIYNLVTKNLNGSIEVKSTEGYGAVFEAVIPLDS
jgi:signal transduction histidine kinase